ncbi:putative outer membrane fimbrial user protein [Escherichia coli M605]|uniref:Putative outer membrane fimbrial user protein n=1 Tax=Escherichia coli M605 TaxID=656417 RepID=F4SYH2_ECOLX|nr:TcfC E-set like domain-containing protein [Escherichia coli]EGI16419.1 putative outer membrane fimbrial user protein [Escherichia coli M605]
MWEPGFYLKKLSPFILWIMAGVPGSPAYARNVPAGFEALSLGQSEWLNVSFQGEDEGVFSVFVTPDSLTFREPRALSDRLPLEELPEETRKKILAELSSPLPRHDEAFHLAPGENIGVLYNEQEQSVMLLINPAWFNSNNRQFWHPSQNSHLALVSHQSLVFSHDNQTESLGGTGTLAQGLSDRSYLQGDWTLFQNVSRNTPSTSQFRFSNLFLRSDLTQGTYVQGGRMDITNLNSRLGGNFSLSLLPLAQTDGIRLGSTSAYVNTQSNDNTGSSPLTVMLAQPARIDVYRGERLLGTSYMDAGIHDVDTSNFPAGAYPVTLKEYENGRLVRQETQFFENSGQHQPAGDQPQWFLQAGRRTMADTYNEIKKSPKRKNKVGIAGGLQLALSHNVTWTGAILTAADNNEILSENDLSWTIPSQTGLWTLKTGYLMQGGLSTADNEQISWNYNGNTFYLSRYHTFCRGQIAGGCYSNYSTTASTELYGWTASLGYNYSRSVQRFWQLPEMTDSINPDGYPQIRTTEPTSDKQYSTSGVLLTLGTSVNYKNWNIWPRMGVFSNRSRNGYLHDSGGFLTLSLSGSSQLNSDVSSNTTAILDYRQHSQDNNLSLRQQWVSNSQNYRSLGIMFSGGENTQGALVSGEWDGSLGNSGMAASYNHSRKYSNRTLNGHYDSTFAVSSTGLVWGNRGGNESSMSGVVVDARNNRSEDISGPVAKIVSGQVGDVYLKDGRQAFLPLMDYMPDEVTVENAGTHGANGNIVRGAGKHNVFLLPGHVAVSRLRADAVYIYVGRLLVNGNNLLAGGHILNAEVPDINPDGSFVAEFNFSPDLLYVLKNRQFFICPVKYTKGFNGIRRMKNTNCRLTRDADLPETMRKSERVARLITMANRH